MERNFIWSRHSPSPLFLVVLLWNHIPSLKYRDHLSSEAPLTNKSWWPWSSLRHWHDNPYALTFESFIRKNWINYW